VSPSRAGRDPVPDPIERLRVRLTERCDALTALFTAIAEGTPSPETLHVGHQGIRRLRIDGALWSGLVPPGWAIDHAATDVTLKRLGRAVGEVRDLDVGLELVAGLGPGNGNAAPTADRRSIVRVMQRHALDGRRSLRSAYPPALATELVERVARPLRASLPRARGIRLGRELDDTTTVALARLERSLARAYRRPTVRRLHRLRGTLRAVRYLDLARQEIAGRRPLAPAEPLRAFQDELGVLNDWVVLRRLGRRLDLPGSTDPLRARCREQIRSSRRRLVRALERKAVRRAFASLLAASPG